MSGAAEAWAAPEPPPRLDDGAAHVWRIHLDYAPRQIDALRATLTPDEVARAERFVFPRDRDRFIAARGQLRAILAGYLGQAPAALRFCYGEHGKPALAVPPDAGLHFNLSHSHQLALVAVTRVGRVGVDVEHIRPSLDYEPLAASVFSAAEQAALSALPEPQRLAAFFACWTRKEAFVKARGEGLALALDQFDVSLRPGEPAALLRIGEARGALGWSLRALFPADGYAAALAVEGQLERLGLYTAAPPAGG